MLKRNQITNNFHKGCKKSFNKINRWSLHWQCFSRLFNDIKFSFKTCFQSIHHTWLDCWSFITLKSELNLGKLQINCITIGTNIWQARRELMGEINFLNKLGEIDHSGSAKHYYAKPRKLRDYFFSLLRIGWRSCVMRRARTTFSNRQLC
jgi:hypothetical protein